MLVGANNGAVDHQPFEVGILQLAEDPFPDSLARPSIKPSPNRIPIAKTFGQIAPWGAGFRNPENGINEEPIIGGNARVAFFSRQKILDAFKVFIRDRMATKHGKPSLAREKRAAVYQNRLIIVHTA